MGADSRFDPGTLAGVLIVSCQARADSPLASPEVMAVLAHAAVLGGAGGIRACGAADIRHIRSVVDVPLIGLTKRTVADSPVYITPTFVDAAEVVASGADLVAIDATDRARPERVDVRDLITRIVSELGVGVVADVDSVAAAKVAATAGAAFVATTLAGYTAGHVPAGPDIDLVRRIADEIGGPVIAEGRYQHPDQVEAAFRAGAHAVVVGKAITDPIALTRRLAAMAPRPAPGGRR
ncbi:MAG: putative N-acetylmannosamine-6-phosphate 2-epimerase [Chloroflexi bacterium]|nr:putative N-acetylmannosamine-6-phosphate 2-epimerase [Chloroflexota bacterium]